MEKVNENRTIYSLVSLDKVLRDMRFTTHGSKFGQVGKLAQQYGIQVDIVQPPQRVIRRANKFNQSLKTCYAFTAPRSRLQKLVEKFHFSLTKYSKTPYWR